MLANSLKLDPLSPARSHADACGDALVLSKQSVRSEILAWIISHQKSPYSSFIFYPCPGRLGLAVVHVDGEVLPVGVPPQGIPVARDCTHAMKKEASSHPQPFERTKTEPRVPHGKRRELRNELLGERRSENDWAVEGLA